MNLVSNLKWDLPLNHPPELKIAAVDNFTTLKKSFRLPYLWQLHLVHYHADFWIEENYFELRPGFAILIPPGTQITTSFHRGDNHHYAHFNHNTIKSNNLDTAPMPAIVSLVDSEYFEIKNLFEKICSSHNKKRAEINLWEILYQLHDGLIKHNPSEDVLHPAVKAAIELINLRRHQKLSTSELATEVGLSQSHLTRLFHKHLNTSIAKYIRQRKMEHLQYMLKHSTTPIKNLAYDIGSSDLQAFNKTVRKYFGVSPRKLQCLVRAGKPVQPIATKSKSA